MVKSLAQTTVKFSSEKELKLLPKQLIVWGLQRNFPKYMVEILGQTTPKSASKIVSKLP